MQPSFYRLFGFAMIGLGLVNLISLFCSLYNPLLGISIFIPIGIGLIGWAGLNLWTVLKTDDPELRAEPLSTLGETIFLLIIGSIGIFAGVM